MIARLLACFVSCVLLIGCHSTPLSRGSADIALYVDEGTEEGCVRATDSMFAWMGYTVERVDAEYVREIGLDSFRVLCVPGGDMYVYSQSLSSDGVETIREFVRDGGGYVGICGGAYFSAERVFWRGMQLPMESLGFFRGTSRGPVPEIAPPDGQGMCRISIVDTAHAAMPADQDSAWILYWVGPELLPDDEGEVAVLGRYDATGTPVILAREYGDGRVFVIGTHPEFEEDDDRDGVDFCDSYDDRGSDWEMMRCAVEWCLGESQ